MDQQILTSLFSDSKKISLITHINPDGDAIGSSIGLAYILKMIDSSREVRIFTPNRTPQYLTSIRGFDFVTDYIAKTQNSANYIENESDLIICVDFSDYNSRTGEIGKHIDANKKAKKILFDHHVAPDLSPYTIAFSDETESSTAHVVVKTMIKFGYGEMIRKEAATALFTGMMTDTGNFSYGNLSSELFRSISFLIDKGVDPAEVNDRIFNVKNESALRLNGFALSKKMVVSYPMHAAVVTLSAAELKKYNYTSGDAEGIVNQPLSIDGIYNSAFFMEQDGFIKVSLRSVKDKGRDVNAFARKYFNGGGHINAAGGRAYNTTLEECAEIFIKNIERKSRS